MRSKNDTNLFKGYCIPIHTLGPWRFCNKIPVDVPYLPITRFNHRETEYVY